MIKLKYMAVVKKKSKLDKDKSKQIKEKETE